MLNIDEALQDIHGVAEQCYNCRFLWKGPASTLLVGPVPGEIYCCNLFGGLLPNCIKKEIQECVTP